MLTSELRQQVNEYLRLSSTEAFIAFFYDKIDEIVRVTDDSAQRINLVKDIAFLAQSAHQLLSKSEIISYEDMKHNLISELTRALLKQSMCSENMRTLILLFSNEFFNANPVSTQVEEDTVRGVLSQVEPIETASSIAVSNHPDVSHLQRILQRMEALLADIHSDRRDNRMNLDKLMIYQRDYNAIYLDAPAINNFLSGRVSNSEIIEKLMDRQEKVSQIIDAQFAYFNSIAFYIENKNKLDDLLQRIYTNQADQALNLEKLTEYDVEYKAIEQAIQTYLQDNPALAESHAYQRLTQARKEVGLAIDNLSKAEKHELDQAQAAGAAAPLGAALEPRLVSLGVAGFFAAMIREPETFLCDDILLNSIRKLSEDPALKDTLVTEVEHYLQATYINVLDFLTEVGEVLCKFLGLLDSMEDVAARSLSYSLKILVCREKLDRVMTQIEEIQKILDTYYQGPEAVFLKKNESRITGFTERVRTLDDVMDSIVMEDNHSVDQLLTISQSVYDYLILIKAREAEFEREVSLLRSPRVSSR